MSNQRKRIIAGILIAVVVYALTPFVAGLVGTYDLRGPKIFFTEHHVLLYRIGDAFIPRSPDRDGKPRVPYMRERSWFYGIEGKPTPKRDIAKEIEEYERRAKQ